MQSADTAVLWQEYYDRRSGEINLEDCMRVLGYYPPEGVSFEGLFANVLAEIRERLQPGPYHRLLDIGCGYAIFTRALAQEVRTAVGTDLSGVLLRQGVTLGQEVAVNGLAQARAEWQPFRPHTFDRILCYNMFCHLDPQDASKVVKEILRLLKPGGRALIGDIQDPERFHLERSYIDRVPPSFRGLLKHVLRLKRKVDCWRSRMVYWSYAPRFFVQLLPPGVALEVFEQKTDGRRNNAARYDVVLQLPP